MNYKDALEQSTVIADNKKRCQINIWRIINPGKDCLEKDFI